MSEAHETPSLGPVGERERIAALDVLRGAAIFGIFMVNMQFFAMSIVDLVVPAPPAGGDAAETACWWVVKVLFEYKFVSIFSLLFGMGMVVQRRRAAARGRPFTPLYLRRTFVLMGIGLAHALLLWYGDILFVYSVASLLVLPLLRLRPKILVILAASWFGLSLGIVGCFGAIDVITGSTFQPPVAIEVMPDESGEPGEPDETDGVDRWTRFTDALGRVTTGDRKDDLSAWREVEVMAYKDGPMAATLIVRAGTFVIVLAYITLGGFGFRVVGMFLLGAALMKLDFFDARRRRWHLLMCAVGLPLGVAVDALAAGLIATGGPDTAWRLAMADPVHQVGSVLLCGGYVGAVTLLVAGGALRPLTRALACVGRTALSNYLLQTVVTTFLMYWWGLGWFGDVTRVQQVALVAVIFAGQVIVSVLWLRYFTIGPLEWVWRSMTYLSVQPIRRRRYTGA